MSITMMIVGSRKEIDPLSARKEAFLGHMERIFPAFRFELGVSRLVNNNNIMDDDIHIVQYMGELSVWDGERPKAQVSPELISAMKEVVLKFAASEVGMTN